jgi:hypothetical protein
MTQPHRDDSARLTAEDKIEIHELLARRAQAADYRDVDAWVDTFTSDGVLEQPDVVLDLPGGASKMRPTVCGSEQLHAFLEASLPNIAGLRHWVGNIITEGTADGAVARSIFNVVDIGKGAASVVTGRYIEVLTRTDHGWRTARLKVEMDMRDPPRKRARTDL